jgi:hypothetical protein
VTSFNVAAHIDLKSCSNFENDVAIFDRSAEPRGAINSRKMRQGTLNMLQKNIVGWPNGLLYLVRDWFSFVPSSFILLFDGRERVLCFLFVFF